MTVSSLWKVLDEAGCSVTVGVDELLDPNHLKSLTNPWNFNDQASSPKKRPTLAVDLSIWICEGLTSPAMSVSHANPALHLVYTRSLKLLSLGVKLVIVIEGKRRVRRTEEPDNFRKRRSGGLFWKSCKECEAMFECLGVPVVKAKAEGEALCALLNERGVVDGVISNDGDCLLFGAKVVYTKFSIENLANSQIKRYDSSNLKAIVEDENGEDRSTAEDNKISLSRHDLISFALLTGSDLAGNGLPKVGYKKAIRFISKCKHDHPLSSDNAAIAELRSWARTAKVVHSFAHAKANQTDKTRCCSLCNHPGDKRGHLKAGCEICGTEPGEPCFEFTGSDRFRGGLREKALALVPKFDPATVVDAYLRPNDNSIPLLLEGASSTSVELEVPSLSALLSSNLIIKGESHAASRQYVIESLSRLLTRQDLFGTSSLKMPGIKTKKRSLSKEVPVPVKITRKLVKDQTHCFEVSWRVDATVTDSNGDGIDGYEFTTVEPQKLFKNRYPDLISSFIEAQIEQQKQGDAERMKRREFVETLLKKTNEDEVEIKGDQHGRKKVGKKKRIQEDFFEVQRARRADVKRPRVTVKETEEIKAIMRRLGGQKTDITVDYDYSTIASGSIVFHICDPVAKKRKQYGQPKRRVHEVDPLGMTITVFKAQTKEQLSEKNAFTMGVLSPVSIPKAVHSEKNDMRRLNEQVPLGLVLERPKSESPVPEPILLDERHGAEVEEILGKSHEAKGVVLDKRGKGYQSANQECMTACDLVKDDDGIGRVGEWMGHEVVWSAMENLERLQNKKARISDHVSNNICVKNQVEPKWTAVNVADPEVILEHSNLTRHSLFIPLENNHTIETYVRASQQLPVDKVLTMKGRMPLELEEPRTPIRGNVGIREDPDDWMSRLVLKLNDENQTSDAEVCRRLNFGDLTPVKADEIGRNMPSLTPGRRHLIVCDMGIPVRMSPIVARRSSYFIKQQTY